MKRKRKRDFLKVFDLTSKEIERILDRAAELKRGSDAGKCPIIGKSVGLFFEKASTRTRVSFEVGIYQLGGQSLYLNPREIQLGRGETIADTGRVLSRYVQAIAIRTFGQWEVEELAHAADVPVINALTDLEHPCQTLADLLTIKERLGELEGNRVAYVGDGNNVANSLALGCALGGVRLTIGCPPGYEPDADIMEKARELGGEEAVVITHDAQEAVAGALVVYTDVWTSMGQEEDDQRKKDLEPFRVDDDLLIDADPMTIVMHCLPAHRGEEITDDVIDGPRSVVWDQAENRMHAQAGLLSLLIGD